MKTEKVSPPKENKINTEQNNLLLINPSLGKLIFEDDEEAIDPLDLYSTPCHFI